MIVTAGGALIGSRHPPTWLTGGRPLPAYWSDRGAGGRDRVHGRAQLIGPQILGNSRAPCPTESSKIGGDYGRLAG